MKRVVRVLLKRLTTKLRPKATVLVKNNEAQDNYTAQDKSVILRQVSSSIGMSSVHASSVCEIQDKSVIRREVSSSVRMSSSVCDDFKIDTVLLYVLYNPVHRAYGSNVYVINTTNDLTDVSFVSSYPTMLQTYKSKIVYVQHTTRALELKRLVYEMLHMFQVHLERPLFNCRLELIISVIEQCTKDMCNSLF